MLAVYHPQALRRGWLSVVVVEESRTETSPAALTWLLAQAGGAKLGYPVVADATGRPAAVTLPGAGSSVGPPGRFRRGPDTPARHPRTSRG